MNINEMSTRDLCQQWKPYAEQLGKVVKTYLADRGETKIGSWQLVLRVNPSLAQDLGIDLTQPWSKPVASALSFFYAYHISGTRKERDRVRRAKERSVSTPEQRAAWREQKRESNARLAAGERRKVHHTRVKPIIARREDLELDLPSVELDVGLRGTLLRTIEQLQSLLKAIE